MVKRLVFLGWLVAAAHAAPVAAAAPAADPAPVGAPPTAAAAGPVRVRHVPVASADGSTPLVIEAEVDSAFRAKRIELHYRRAAGAEYQAAAFARQTETHYVATIPAPAVTPPGLEYAISSVDDGGHETYHFASLDHPHPVVVTVPEDTADAAAELALVHGRRSRLQLSGEMVDFGTRETGDGKVQLADRYSRIEADFTFRLLGKVVHSFRLGYGRMRGETPDTGRVIDENTTSKQTGLDYGFAEMRFRQSDAVHFEGRFLMGANASGFAFGGRGTVQLGRDDRSFVSAGLESIQGVGTSAFLGMTWDTVPHARMSATIYGTNFPAPVRDVALRLVYDIEVPLGDELFVAANLGYQARDKLVGGLAGGLRAGVQF